MDSFGVEIFGRMKTSDKPGATRAGRRNMDEIELKPCPFCGDKGVVQRNGHCFRAYCPNRDCPIEPRTHWFFNHLLAIETWNRRAEHG
jgi:hypothetical protein